MTEIASVAGALPEWPKVPNLDDFGGEMGAQMYAFVAVGYQDLLIAALRARLELAVKTMDDVDRYWHPHIDAIIAACREPK